VLKVLKARRQVLQDLREIQVHKEHKGPTQGHKVLQELRVIQELRVLKV
jgi:hypothetical protein